MQYNIDLIHTMAQEQGIRDLNGNFTYKALLGQELDYDNNNNDSQNVNIIDEMEENDHNNGFDEDAASTDSNNGNDVSQDSADKGVYQSVADEGTNQAAGIKGDILDYDE